MTLNRLENLGQRLFLITTLILLVFTPIAAEAFLDTFKDPKDGAFDTSNWLSQRTGFLPVPLFISDPAVGYGLGAALLFFHESPEDKEKARMAADDDIISLPPSVTAVAGAYTENESWILAGGHFGSWRNDYIRYTGALGLAGLNLRFYGTEERDIETNSLAFNLGGFFLFQELIFRIFDSNFFLGANYTFLDATMDFGIPEFIPGVSEIELESRDAGLGLVARHDSRDNIISPNSGHYGELLVTNYDEIFGGDFDYTFIKARSLSWWNIIPKIVLGARLDGRFVSGFAPIYSVPYIDLRGIGALRYQGDDVVVAELEPRWDITDRWSLVGFIGSGWAADSIGDLGDTSAKVAGGAGFRYLLARRLGLRVGLDVARGPEETVVYLQVGSGWL